MLVERSRPTSNNEEKSSLLSQEFQSNCFSLSLYSSSQPFACLQCSSSLPNICVWQIISKQSQSQSKRLQEHG